MVPSRRLRRLQREAESSLLDAQAAWMAWTMARLSTRDLEHIEAATERGFDPDEDEAYQDVTISSEERAAFRRYFQLYEEAKRGF